MTDPQHPYGQAAPQYGQPQVPAGQHGGQYGAGQYGGAYGGQPMPAPAPGSYAAYRGPIGKVRGTGVCILLSIVTFGIYSLVWFFQVHEEMKKHTGDGLGGALGLILAIFVGFVSPFLTSNEVGKMYENAGRPAPVSALTGLWYIPGILILVGPIVWFVKTNGALNDYWRSVGAH